MAIARNPKQVPKSTVNNSSVRAQILATEHWSLLATRSMTWSEVMSRITIHLSITSASLVVLALMAQVSGFGTSFRVLAIGLTTAILILGTLTGVRVLNASIDDISMIQGMNRLRAAYTELDPEIKKYLVTAYNDDRAGIMQSSLMGVKRSLSSHILGSTNMYMEIVNTLVAGTLGALVANTAGGSPLVTTSTGLLTGTVCLLCWLKVNRNSFLARKISANFPSPHSSKPSNG
jgi:hypothetical protein